MRRGACRVPRRQLGFFLMHARILFPTRQLLCPSAIVALALAVVGGGRSAWGAPSANPVAGEFEGEHQYTGKDGQEHEIEAPDNRDRGKFNKVLGNGKAASKEEQDLFERVSHYYVYALTWSENIPKLPDRRSDLKKILVMSGKSAVPELHDQLNRMTLKVCGDAADDARYPLAIRYICLLMIGDLDAKESTTTSKTVIPLPDARKRLLDVLGDGQQPVELRVAAVLSLLRHLHLWQGISAEDQNRLTEAAMAIIGVPLDPKRDSAGSIWLRLRAFEALRMLSAKGVKVDQSAVAAALSTIVADERIATWIRCHATGELESIEAAQFPPGTTTEEVRAVANLIIAMSASNPFTKFARQAALEKEAAEKEENSRDGRESRRRNRRDSDEKDADKAAEKPEDKQPALPLTARMREVAAHSLLHDLGRVRLGLLGRGPARRGELPHSTTHGLYAACDADAQKAIKIVVTHLDEMLAELSKLDPKKDTVGKEEIAEVALAIENSGRAMAEELGDMLTAPSEATTPESEPEPAVAAPSAGRERRPASGPPAGNAAAGESAVAPNK